MEGAISKKGRGELGQGAWTEPLCCMLGTHTFSTSALQIAPFDENYAWKNTTDNFLLGYEFDTKINDKFRGNFYQQVCRRSVISCTLL